MRQASSSFTTANGLTLFEQRWLPGGVARSPENSRET